MSSSSSIYTSPQPGLLNSPIQTLQGNAKGRVSQMLNPTVVLGQTQGQPTTGNPVLSAFGLVSSQEVNPNQIVTFTADPNQSISIVLADGTVVSMTLNYFAGQEGWFYSLNYNNGAFIANNRRLVTSPNMLSQFKNLIEFGLSVVTTDDYEPIFLTDFVTGRASFYILESVHVAAIEGAIVNVA